MSALFKSFLPAATGQRAASAPATEMDAPAGQVGTHHAAGAATPMPAVRSHGALDAPSPAPVAPTGGHRVSSPSPARLFPGGGGGAAGQQVGPSLSTLFSRLETSTVLGERRKALKDIVAVVSDRTMTQGVMSALEAHHVSMLRDIFHLYREDAEITADVLEALVGISGTVAQAAGVSSSHSPNRGGGPHGTPTTAGQPPHGSAAGAHQTAAQNQCQSLLQPVMEVSMFIDLLRQHDAGFWTKYNSVTVLAKLHAVNPGAFSDQLMTTPEGVECLINVLNDTSNGGALRDEGLLLFAELTGQRGKHEVQTLLAFQNCFESLFHIVAAEGGAVQDSVIVKDCLTIIHNLLKGNKQTQKLFTSMNSAAQLTTLLKTNFAGAGGVDMSTGASDSPVSQTAVEILMLAATIVETLLRAGDSNSEGNETRKALNISGVQQALVVLALETLPLARDPDDAATFEAEALRILCLSLHNCKDAVEGFLRQTTLYQGATLPAAWSVLRLALCDTVHARACAAAHILSTVLTTKDAGDLAQAVITKGLAPKSLNTQHGQQCGFLLGSFLFASRPPSPLTQFIASHVFAACLTAAGPKCDSLMVLPWVHDQALFASFIQHAASLIANRQADFPTCAAALRPVFVGLRSTPKALFMLLSDAAQMTFFADWAAGSRDGCHVPFLCACLVGLALGVCPGELPATCRMDRAQLHAVFTKTITLQRYEALRDAVHASAEWQHAPRTSALAALPNQVIYDGDTVELLKEVDRAIFAIMAPPPAAAAATAPTPAAAAAPAGAATTSRSGSTGAAGDGAQPGGAPPTHGGAPTNGHHRTASDVAALAAAEEREKAFAKEKEELLRKLQAKDDELSVERERNALASREMETKLQVSIAAAHDAAAAEFALKRAELDGAIKELEHQLEAAHQNKGEEQQALAATVECLEKKLRDAKEEAASKPVGVDQAIVDKALSERDATISDLEGQLQELREEHDDLLCLVAELDEYNQDLIADAERDGRRTEFDHQQGDAVGGAVEDVNAVNGHEAHALPPAGPNANAGGAAQNGHLDQGFVSGLTTSDHTPVRAPYGSQATPHVAHQAADSVNTTAHEHQDPHRGVGAASGNTQLSGTYYPGVGANGDMLTAAAKGLIAATDAQHHEATVGRAAQHHEASPQVMTAPTPAGQNFSADEATFVVSPPDADSDAVSAFPPPPKFDAENTL